MKLVVDLVNLLNGFLADPGPYRPALAAIKGLRNGAVYGAKIRAPHAFVMTFLFRDGTLTEKLKLIIQATLSHSRNLAFFVFVYKSLKAILLLTAKDRRRHPLHVFLSGFAAGYVVFNKKNQVSNQIILYLLSRILMGLLNVAITKKLVTPPKNVEMFPWVAATVWGIVMVLFEYERATLQDSLVSSMTYLYDDSESWTNLKDFLWHNK